MSTFQVKLTQKSDQVTALLLLLQVKWNSKEPSPPNELFDADGKRVARLFAFGEAKARRRAQTTVRPKWDGAHDWFVA